MCHKDFCSDWRQSGSVLSVSGYLCSILFRFTIFFTKTLEKRNSMAVHNLVFLCRNYCDCLMCSHGVSCCYLCILFIVHAQLTGKILLNNS